MNSPYQSTGFDTRVTLGAEYQSVLRTCNLNMVHLFATAATSGDPVAAAILGTDESVLAEFKTTRRSDLVKLVGNLSVPMFRFRYTDPLVVRSLLKNGMADAVVQRAFLKDIPFSIFEPTGRA
jgi:hypothetical protein